MGNSLRCCLACVLPCGALDLVRVVHINGRMEEYSRPVVAAEVLSANPGHVLTKPCSLEGGGVVRRILIVSPDSELRRGHIYFLIPESSLPEKKRRKGNSNAAASTKKKQQQQQQNQQEIIPPASESETSDGEAQESTSPERKRSPHHRRRRSGRVEAWKPHLQSILEDL